MQGTPGGAAAKEVAKLSLQKLRGMQQQLAEAEERAAGADHTARQLGASLAEAQQKLAAAAADAEARATEAARLADSVRQGQEQVASLSAKAASEEEGRRAASSQVTVRGVWSSGGGVTRLTCAV